MNKVEQIADTMRRQVAAMGGPRAAYLIAAARIDAFADPKWMPWLSDAERLANIRDTFAALELLRSESDG